MKPLNIDKRIWINLFFILLIVSAIGLFVFKFITIFGYVLIAICLGYMLNPFIRRLEKYGLSKSKAFAIVIIYSLIITTFALMITIPTMSEEFGAVAEKWPGIQEKINNELLQEKFLEDGTKYYHSPLLNIDISKEKIDTTITSIQTNLDNLASDLVTIIFKLLLIVPIITYILINQGADIKRAFFHLIPNQHFEIMMAITNDINKAIENFISAKLIQTIIIAVSASLGFLIIDLNMGILLGIFVGIMNIIPYVGPFIGAVPAIAAAYLLVDTQTALLTLGVLAVVQLIDNLIVQPVILPKLVNEHPLIVIIITLLGAELYGAIGMVIAIPVFSILKIIISKSYEALDFFYSRAEDI